MIFIKLTQGKFAQVDPEDFDHLNQFKWFYEKTGYACRRVNGRSIRMHRFVMNAPEGMEVDHINGDGLDNRQSNLRICTHKENLRNVKIRKTNTSGFKGVRRNGSGWQACIYVDGKNIGLGTYKDKLEAVRVRAMAENEYFGDFRRTN